MLIRFLKVFRGPLTVFVLLSMQVLAFPSTTLAQGEGLTFEQAQTRTAFARKQMQASQRELNEAEAREEAALSVLDEARKNADQATEERQRAEKKYQEAQDRWSRESERLKRIHQRNITNSPAR